MISKWIPGYENRYSITTCGEVYSHIKGVNRKNTFINSKGYLRVGLYKNNKQYKYFIHRLVAIAFMGYEGIGDINHKDCNKLNNEISNLEIISHRDNIKHSWKNGLNSPVYGEDHKMSKLTKDEVLSIIKSEDSVINLSKNYNISKTHVKRIKDRKCWRHLCTI